MYVYIYIYIYIYIQCACEFWTEHTYVHTYMSSQYACQASMCSPCQGIIFRNLESGSAAPADKVLKRGE